MSMENLMLLSGLATIASPFRKLNEIWKEEAWREDNGPWDLSVRRRTRTNEPLYAFDGGAIGRL